MNIPAQLRILFKNVEYTENSQNHMNIFKKYKYK